MIKLIKPLSNFKQFQERQKKIFSLLYSRFLRYRCYVTIIWLSFTYIALPLKAQNIHHQPLTADLSAKSSTNKVTADWLLELPDLSDDRPSIQWIDNSHLIYTSLKISENKHKWTIEIIDLQSGEHKFLSEGLMPRPSPDGEWIAFSKGEGKEKQLWIISKNGINLKQLSQVEGGLGAYGYSYDFAWAPDSKKNCIETSIIS